MSLATLQRDIAKLREAIRQHQPPTHPTLDRIRTDPAALMTLAGLSPDPWQRRLLSCPSPRTLLLCSRQAGKSTASASLALLTALVQPAALVLLLSPSLRQSVELFRKVVAQYRAVGKPVGTVRETALALELANGSRVISLPGTEATIRGFSGATLLIIDEASRVPDDLYRTVRPMLAVSQGRLVGLSTPFVQAGWFYTAWTGKESWDRVMVKATDCPRISPAFLAEERSAMGPRWYRMEYECSFEDAVGAVFDAESIRAAVCDDLPPLRLGVQ